MNLQQFKEEAIKLNALSTKELGKFYRISKRYQSTDGSEVTTFMMLFPKSLVSSMEMAYAIERLVEWRDYQSRAVDNSGRRVYDDDMRRIDGSSSESVLPVIISNIDKLNVIDPLPWDKPGQHGSLDGISRIITSAKTNGVDIDHKDRKISEITEQQVIRAVEVDIEVLDEDAVIELEEAYLILHWDSAA